MTRPAVPDDAARPLLVGDAAAVPRGAWTFLDGGRGVWVLPRAAYDLYHRIAPALDGASALAVLVAPLEPAQARAVRALVGQLAAAGLVRDGRAADASGLSPAQRAHWAGPIAFLESQLDEPEVAFARYRAKAVEVTGAEPLAGVVRTALLRSGVARADVQRRALAGADVLVSCGPGRALAVRLDGELAHLLVTSGRQTRPAPAAPTKPALLHGPAVQVLAARAAFTWLCLEAGLLDLGSAAVQTVLTLDLRDLRALRELRPSDRRAPLGGGRTHGA